MTTNNEATPQPGDLNAELVRMYPADYVQALAAQGVAEEYAEDYQKSLAASAVLRMHAQELFGLAHQGALTAQGFAIDPSVAPPGFAAKAAAAGLSARDILEFATSNYDEPGDRLKHLERELANAKKFAELPDDPRRNFGSPF